MHACQPASQQASTQATNVYHPPACAVDVLLPLSEACSSQGISLVTHVKPKGEDGSAQVKELVAAIKASVEGKVRPRGVGKRRGEGSETARLSLQC